MSRKGNRPDNGMMGSFFGILKSEMFYSFEKQFNSLDELKQAIINYIDYYNNRRYQWHLARLSPNEFYKFVTTGKYPLDIPNIPAMPAIKKDPKELGASAVDIDDNK